jgi:hypothetical protein
MAKEAMLKTRVAYMLMWLGVVIRFCEVVLIDSCERAIVLFVSERLVCQRKTCLLTKDLFVNERLGCSEG